MNQETRDAIEALYLHVYFRGGKALRGRKLNQREEELFKATSIVAHYLAKTKTLVEISRSYDEFIEGQGVAVELWGWLQDRGMAAPVRPLI
jgi:hypothetical protein